MRQPSSTTVNRVLLLPTLTAGVIGRPIATMIRDCELISDTVKTLLLGNNQLRIIVIYAHSKASQTSLLTTLLTASSYPPVLPA